MGFLKCSEGDCPAHASELRPERQVDADEHREEAATEKSGEKHSKKNSRERQHHVGQSHDYRIDNPPGIGRDQAKCRSQSAGNRNAQKCEPYGARRTVQNAGKDIAPQMVAAKRMGEAWRFKDPHEVLRRRVMRRDE
jgi:hypothetical protein